MKNKKRTKKKKEKLKNKTGMFGIIAKQVEQAALPLCASENVELIAVECEVGVVRVYIDKSDGISLNDCVLISKQLSNVLDVVIDDIGAYRLEVSSPGDIRFLKKEKDFERFNGKKAEVQCVEDINGQTIYTGILTGYSDGQVQLMINDEIVAIPYDKINNARLIIDNGEYIC